jgi:SSS family solute:Na+ symporter
LNAETNEVKVRFWTWQLLQSNKKVIPFNPSVNSPDNGSRREANVDMEIADWVVVAAYAVGMLAVGQYYARRNKTTDDYLLGGRRMSPVAVGLSLFATLTSSLSYLAVPGEMVKNGPMMLATILAFPLIGLVVGWGLIPFIMRQRVTSAYEMLEQRFGLSIRLIGALMFLTMRLAWMGTILYATSDKVLSPLMGLGPQATLWATVVMCLITLIYTAEGGLRAVVVTDAIQSLIMIGGAGAVIVIVSADLGGVLAWWPSQWAAHWAEPRFSFDASTRMTFLGAATSSFAWYVCTCGSDQMAIQRWLSMRDAPAARRSLFTTLGAEALVSSLLGVVGLAVLGYFTAHPEQFVDGDNLVAEADKLFPRFIAVGLPTGMSGVIFAAVLAAAMSSLSSGMNSSSAVITEDFVCRFRSASLSDAGRVQLARLISIAVGITAILLSLLISRIEGNLVDLCYRAVNLLVAPLFVLFFLAIFVRWATTFGAWVAALTSVATAVCIAFSKPLGFEPMSIMWIMPGSFVAGVAGGSLASLLPIGRSPAKGHGTSSKGELDGV